MSRSWIFIVAVMINLAICLEINREYPYYLHIRGGKFHLVAILSAVIVVVLVKGVISIIDCLWQTTHRVKHD